MLAYWSPDRLHWCYTSSTDPKQITIRFRSRQLIRAMSSYIIWEEKSGYRQSSKFVVQSHIEGFATHLNAIVNFLLVAHQKIWVSVNHAIMYLSDDACTGKIKLYQFGQSEVLAYDYWQHQCSGIIAQQCEVKATRSCMNLKRCTCSSNVNWSLSHHSSNTVSSWTGKRARRLRYTL